LPELLSKDKIDAIVKRTANGGAEIVALLKTGSAFYAPSVSAVQMAEAILYDRQHILPCAVWLEGEYGIKDVFVGVPTKLGARGLESIIQLKLSADEQAALNKSAESVRELQKITGV
jgi:malate dehydrogenase